jgi:glycine betaine/proline transport system substrate-binding protein
MKKSNFIFNIFALALISIFLFSCNKPGKDEKQEEIVIYSGNWAETIAMTKVTELALEDVGIPVKMTLIEPGPIYASLAKGDGDIFLESWLPQTHSEYWEKYGSKLDKAGISFDYATTGLVVPEYVTINSIEELNANKDKFSGKIIGIGSGAGIHKDTETAIKEYNLDFDQITSSGPAMMASLKKAVTQKEWVVITGWKPHHKWAMYDLKYLEDPKNVYPSEKAYIITRKGFTKEQPGFKEFLGNFYFKEEQLFDLMMTFKEMDDEDKAAQKWYSENKELMRSWMPEEWKK